MNRKKLIIITLILIAVLITISLTFLILSTNGHNLLERVSQIRKAQTESDMKEKLQSAISELQAEKEGKATLDDITQEWINEKITDYECLVTTDPSISGKKVILQKSAVISKFMLDENINISEIEKSDNGIELSYEALNRTDENVQGLVVVENYEDNLKSINFIGKNNNIQTFKNKKIAIDYEIPLGEEQKIELSVQDGTIQEKNLIIEDYWHTITKKLSNGLTLNNLAIKAAYNKPYTATIIAENCAIDSITVTMSGQTIPIDETNTINIEKVTGDIEIVATNNYIIKDGILVNEDYSISSTNGNKTLIQKDEYVQYTASSGDYYGCGVSWKIDNSKNYTKLKCTLSHPSISNSSYAPGGFMFVGSKRAGSPKYNRMYWDAAQADYKYGYYNLMKDGSGTYTEPKNIEIEITGSPSSFYIGIQMTNPRDHYYSRTYGIYELKLE